MIFRDYRGKSRNGNWVCGSLVFLDGFCTIYEDSKRTVSVMPDTVGQWSGVYDINDVKVYEGDIIRDGKYLYLVEFDAPYFCAKEFVEKSLEVSNMKKKVVKIFHTYFQ